MGSRDGCSSLSSPWITFVNVVFCYLNIFLPSHPPCHSLQDSHPSSSSPLPSPVIFLQLLLSVSHFLCTSRSSLCQYEVFFKQLLLVIIRLKKKKKSLMSQVLSFCTSNPFCCDQRTMKEPCCCYYHCL